LASRRFPPPWSIEDIGAAFVVKDASGQKLGNFYYEEEPGRRSAAKLLTKDETRRIAANIGKLWELLRINHTPKLVAAPVLRPNRKVPIRVICGPITPPFFPVVGLSRDDVLTAVQAGSHHPGSHHKHTAQRGRRSRRLEDQRLRLWALTDVAVRRFAEPRHSVRLRRT
jgi:hypothetical protein